MSNQLNFSPTDDPEFVETRNDKPAPKVDYMKPVSGKEMCLWLLLIFIFTCPKLALYIFLSPWLLVGRLI